MSGITGRNAKADTGATRLTGMKVQTTVLGRAVPWVFGTNRVAPNIIQYDDFQAIEKKEKQGGKGGGGSSTSYEYRAAVIMAICRGPIAGIGQIWADKKKHSLSSLGLDFYSGTDTQTAHPHWATNHASRALPYRNLAYAAKASMDLGSGGSVEKHTFEVKSLTRVSDAQPDARVETVITALVTDVVDGLGLAASRLGDLTPLANFCTANGIFLSPVYEDQKEAKALLATLAEIAQCGMLWSDGKLKFVPYSDTAASGNGATYTPSAEAIPELTEDDLLSQGDGPVVRIKRKGVGGVKNHFQIKYSDRANEYNAATVESKDLGAIERFGVLSADVEEFPEICLGTVAQKLADFRRDRAAAVRNTYSFRLSLRWDRLEVMDIVALTYAPEGLAQVTVRITSIDETDDNELQIEAEDCPLGAQQVVSTTPQPPSGGGVDYNQAPGSVAAPVIFEPPLSLTAGRPEIWIATSGGQLWGGADVHISSDGSTYERVAELTSRARHGVLTSSLPLGGLVDTSSTLAVSLAVSGGALMGGTTQDAQDLTTLCYVDGELIAYRDATLTGVSTYNLQYLVRGAHGTDVAAHAAATAFVRLDDSVLRYEYPKQLLGRTVYLKFTSRNIYGAGAQSLADVPAYPYTITGAPLAGVQNLALLRPWTGTEAQVKWDLVDGAISYDAEALAGSPLATKRSVSGLTSGTWTYSGDDARADGGPWRSIAIRVRPVSITGKKGPWKQIVASNPQIGALAGIALTPMLKAISFSCTRPADTDFAGLLIHISATSGFTPSASTLVYDGSDTYVSIGALASGTALAPGVDYYLRAAGYDEFGRDSLTWSSELTFRVTDPVADVGPKIDAALANWTDFEVTAKNMLISDLTNLVSNGKGDSLDGWYPSVAGGCVANPGAHAAYWASAGVSSTSAVHVLCRDTFVGPAFDAKAGDEYFVRADTTPTGGGTLAASFTVGLMWWTASGVAASLPIVTRVLGSTGYALIHGSAALPAGAARARVWVQLNVAAGIVASSGMLVTNLEVRRKNGGELVVDGAITANKIAANAVTADKITANAITGDKIVANTIEGTHIKVNTLQAQHFSSGLPGGNLMPNAAMAATYLDAEGRTQCDGFVRGGINGIPAAEIAIGTNLAGDHWRLPGYNSVAMVQQGASGATNPGAYADIVCPDVSVVSGQAYEISVYTGAHRCTVQSYVYWIDVNGGFVGLTWLTQNAEETTAGKDIAQWKRLYACTVAPAGAIRAVLHLRKLATYSWHTTSWGFWTLPMFGAATSAAQLSPSPWVPNGIGTQISGGLIKTKTLTADAIAVQRLSALSADLGDITAGSLNIGGRFLVAADGSTTIRSGTSGQRMEFDNQTVRVYDSAGVMRVRLGIW